MAKGAFVLSKAGRCAIINVYSITAFMAVIAPNSVRGAQILNEIRNLRVKFLYATLILPFWAKQSARKIIGLFFFSCTLTTKNWLLKAE